MARELHAELLLELWEERRNAGRPSNYTDPIFIVVEGVSHLVEFAEETGEGNCRFMFANSTLTPIVCKPGTILDVMT